MYTKQLVMGGGEEGVEREGEGGEEGRGEGVGITWEFLAKYRSHYEDIESKQHCNALSHLCNMCLSLYAHTMQYSQ